MTPLKSIIREFLKTMADDLKRRSFDETGEQREETEQRLETLKTLIEELGPKEKRRRLECCVCGQDAGNHFQHWNRDTGYGVCSRCVKDEMKRMTPDEIRQSYGEKGLNYETEDETNS